MPWFDVWADGSGSVIELFYVPKGPSYDVTAARAINALSTDLVLTVTTQNADGSLGPQKLGLTFPPGSARSDTQVVADGTFALVPQGNPGSGSFTWDDAVTVGPTHAASAPVKR